MSFKIRRYFSNLFLSVLIDGNDCLCYGRVFKNTKVIKTIEAKFSDINLDENINKVFEYITKLEKSYYATYISLFFDDLTQGALPTTKIEEFKNYNIKSEGLMLIKMKDKFSIYADILAIDKYKNLLKDDRVDLLYSPIALLYHELLKRGIESKTTLYLYSHNSSCALAIFQEKEMKLATFFKINDNDGITTDDSVFKKEDITELSNLITQEENDISLLDDFKSLDDLLKDDELNEFEDIDYDLDISEETNISENVSIFGRDMSIYHYINVAIKEFYKNPIYNSDFIEQIIIFDNTKTSQTFIQYLQSELLVQTSVYPIKTLHIMNELMSREIDL